MSEVTTNYRLAKIANSVQSMDNQMAALLTHVSTLVEHCVHPRYVARLAPDGDLQTSDELQMSLEPFAEVEQTYLFRLPHNGGLACACLTRRQWEEQYEARGSQLVLTYAQPMDFAVAATLHSEIIAFYTAMTATPAESAKEDGKGPHTVTFFHHDSFGAHGFIAETVTDRAVGTVGDVLELWEARSRDQEYEITLDAARWNSPGGARVWDVKSNAVYKDAEAVSQWRIYSDMFGSTGLMPVGFFPEGDMCPHCHQTFTSPACGLGHAMIRNEKLLAETGQHYRTVSPKGESGDS